MASAVQKITLSSSRDIPFNKLVLAQSNVRRVKAGVSIDELAASIARRGLLQSLNVRPILDADGQETGVFEVPAGGRRYRALESLVKTKRLAKTAPVPCVVRGKTDILAEEDSLAENLERAPLHPLDQFRSFQDMRGKGMSEEEIAAAFFVPVGVVKQRLRLASVSAALLAIYEEDGMTLEQLMAFTVTEDHQRQQQVWKAVQSSWSKEPYQIRHMLTESTIRASDKRVRFVGVEAYEQAGGTIMRDLFEADDGGWLQDPALLDRLVTEKLKAAADEIAGEGWKWIEVAVSFPYGGTHGLRRIKGTPADLTDEERATIEALNAEHAQLGAQYEGADELPDEVDARLDEIEAALAAFDERPVRYDSADIARAGVFVSAGPDGRLLVDRGYVRPEDEAPAPGGDAEGGEVDGATETSGSSGIQRAVITIGGAPAQTEDDEEDALRALPDRLMTELTAHRTLALRNALANNPHVAMTVLLHQLVADTFQHRATPGCLEATVRHVFFPVQAEDLKESPSAKAVAERHAVWQRDMPGDDNALWAWLDALDEASRLALLAHCVSYGVNALYERADRYGGGAASAHGVRQRIGQADRLAQAVGLDMAEAGWRPTVANYLGRVTKARILEAVREAKGEAAAQLIDHLRKGDMAKEAERLLADAGWLPEPLRMQQLDEQSSEKGEPNSEADALPEFLSDDEGGDISSDFGGPRPA